MSSRVVLVNVSRQSQVFNLPHELYCANAGRCLCKWSELTLKPHERKGPKTHSRKVRTPSSVTILPQQESRPLDVAVLKLPGVAAALHARPRTLIARHVNGG